MNTIIHINCEGDCKYLGPKCHKEDCKDRVTNPAVVYCAEHQREAEASEKYKYKSYRKGCPHTQLPMYCNKPGCVNYRKTDEDKCICNHSKIKDCYPVTRCACLVHRQPDKIQKFSSKVYICGCTNWEEIQKHMVELEKDANEMRHVINELIDKLENL